MLKQDGVPRPLKDHCLKISLCAAALTFPFFEMKNGGDMLSSDLTDSKPV